MKHFTINGKDYRSKEIDFNFVCDLEDNGVSLETKNMQGKKCRNTGLMAETLMRLWR